jgi:hypothetical protein
MKLQFLRIDSLSESDRHAMYDLLKTHFEGTKLEVFQADLEQKNWVILLRDEQLEVLKGFSTLLMYQTEFAGEAINVVYSGDTITAPSAWSSLALPRGWIAGVKQLRQVYNQGRLYWLLICSGYRTYRFLPTFWREFYPRYDVPTPTSISALMNFLARTQFKQCYDESKGIVRFPHPQVLQESSRGIPENRLADPHVRFFAQKNPGHLQGDELVCLTEICQDNLTPAGERMWFSKTLEAIGFDL